MRLIGAEILEIDYFPQISMPTTGFVVDLEKKLLTLENIIQSGRDWHLHGRGLNKRGRNCWEYSIQIEIVIRGDSEHTVHIHS